MKNPILVSVAAVGLLALGACNSQDTAAGQNVADNFEATADNMEDMADNMSNETAEDAMEDKADAVRETGDNVADAVDDAVENGTMAANKM